MDTTIQFHLDQLKSLRGEIDEKLRELRANERYVLVGIGAVWGFILATLHTKDKLIDQWAFTADLRAWWFACMVAGFGYWRSVALVGSIERLAEYIAHAERTVFLHPHLRGWETYRTDRSWRHERGLGTTQATADTFWWALITITAVVAGVATIHTISR